MNQTVEVPCRLLELISHRLVTVEIFIVRYELQCLLVVGHFRIQRRKVKTISQIVFVDFAEVFVTS